MAKSGAAPRGRRRLLQVACLTPGAALVSSHGLVWIAEQTGWSAVPVGLHTYLPLITLVDRPRLALVALAMAALAAAVARPRLGADLGPRPQAPARSSIWLAAWLAAAQVAFYAAQALVVGLTTGLADQPPAVIAALALPAVLLLLLTLMVSGLSRVGLPRRLVLAPITLLTPPQQLNVAAAVAGHSQPFLRRPPRGPPASP